MGEEYKTNIFPYWHYVRNNDLPTEMGRYLIFWEDNEVIPRYDISSYYPNQDTWILSDGSIYTTETRGVIAWQLLPCKPKRGIYKVKDDE